MTFVTVASARAYRPARGPVEAIAELQRFAGTEFDPVSVDAIEKVLPLSTTTLEPALRELLGRQLV